MYNSFSADEKCASPGSGHFESTESNNVIQQDTESAEDPGTENKVLKKDQCTWIDDKSFEKSFIAK